MFCEYPPIALRGEVFNPESIKRFDVVIISGDAYVDHPSFPCAILYRLYSAMGLKVAIIAQPDWKKDADFMVWGCPDGFFAVAPGAMDSMVANFTSTRMPRKTDRLSPGGVAGLRPKRAAQVYCQKLRQLFKNVPILLGGIEASMRRFVHYDFWEDKLRDPILFDAPADLLVYGMAEAVSERIVGKLLKKSRKDDLNGFAQTCVRVPHNSWHDWLEKPFILLPDINACKTDKKLFMKMSLILDRKIRPEGPVLIQQHPKGDILCFAPSGKDLQNEMKVLESLKFNRKTHPIYKKPVPALEPVQFSIQSHRGCVGSCSFCALSLHQGRVIRSREIEKIVSEARSFVKHPQFKGVIPDVGGPAVNMYQWGCKAGGCDEGLCCDKKLCSSMSGGLKALAEVLDALKKITGIKHVFIGSGMRYDLIKNEDWHIFEKIVANHVSGQLKVAPEHFDKTVLGLMRKGADCDFAKFTNRFYRMFKNKEHRKFLVPYLITAFPGAVEADKILEHKIRELGLVHEQIQEFTPTPGSLASAMYYCEIDFNFRPIKVAKKRKERLKPRERIQAKKMGKNKKQK
jgi:uncharacterized radical SAM protein YgiQ